MTHTAPLGRNRPAALLVLLASLALAACGSAGGTTTSSGSASAAATAVKVDAIANEVPAALKTKGTLVVASDATYPPNESIATDGKTVEGMDPDLVQALATVMGLKVDIQNITFDSILPGIQGGKFDLGASSFSVSAKRQQTVDMVSYFTAGTAFVVKTSGPAINTLADLCGHKVAAELATTQVDDATAQDAKCKAAGKPGVTVLAPKSQNEVNLDLQSDHADVMMLDYPVAVYSVTQSGGQFKVTGTPYNNTPYGFAMAKGTGFAQALLDALKELMKNGVYTSILKKWNVAQGAISDPGINVGT